MRATRLTTAIPLIALTSLLAIVAVVTSASAVTTIDFEPIALDGAGVYNGSDLAGGFSQSGVLFNNNFTDFGGGCCWDAWAASNHVDDTTPGYGNQYSAYPGVAASGSQFAVAYTDAADITLPVPNVVEGGYFTNTTYTALSMRDGDSFAKQFGGPTGTDPDWFNVTIEGWLAGSSTGSEVFYLADYRFADSADDYIVEDWTWVDLSGLGTVDQLTLTFGSSDVGQFGLNTPSYLALDDLVIAPEPSTALLVGLGLAGLSAASRRRR